MCVNATSVFDQDWPDRVLASMKPQPSLCPGFPVEGGLWVSKATARRGRVQWVSQGKVRLVFDDGTTGVTHCTLDFLRLYGEVR